MSIETTKNMHEQLASQNPHKTDSKITNREWLQSLGDEELAMKLCKSCKTCNTDCGYITTCNHGLLVWLKAEHKEVRE